MPVHLSRHSGMSSLGLSGSKSAVLDPTSSRKRLDQDMVPPSLSPGPVLVACDFNEAADVAIRQAHKWATSALRARHRKPKAPRTRVSYRASRALCTLLGDGRSKHRNAIRRIRERLVVCVEDPGPGESNYRNIDAVVGHPV